MHAVLPVKGNTAGNPVIFLERFEAFGKKVLEHGFLEPL